MIYFFLIVVVVVDYTSILNSSAYVVLWKFGCTSPVWEVYEVLAAVEVIRHFRKLHCFLLGYRKLEEGEVWGICAFLCMCVFVCIPVSLLIWKIYLVCLMYSLVFKVSTTSTYLQDKNFSVGEVIRNFNELVFSTGRVGQFRYMRM